MGSETSRYRKNPDVIVRPVGDGSVLLDLESGFYYRLNAVGRSIWEGIENPATLEAIVDVLAKTYEAERETLEADALELLEDLVREGLARREEGK